jgi:Flp pilus assembly protein TadG
MARKFKLKSAPRKFTSNEGGNAAMIFGLGFMPIMLMLGATSDYTKFTSTRSELQQATDAAVLKVATLPDMSAGNMTADQAKARLQIMLNAQNGMSTATVNTTTISSDKRTLCATTSIQVTNSFMQMAQISTLTPQVQTCADLAWGTNPNTTYEIALVLDNSGSMSNGTSGTTKIAALKTAATSFVNTMFTKAPSKVKFSITPFSGAVVAVDPTLSANRTLSWIDTAGLNSQHWTVFGGKTLANAAGFTSRFDIYTKLKTRNSAMDWRGCFEALKYPYNVQDTAVNSGDAETLFVPYLAPDEPSGYSNNNYVDDGGGYSSGGSTVYSCTSAERSSNTSWDNLTRPCKYKVTATKTGSYGPTDFKGPSAYCPDPTTQRIMQLTNSQSTITSKINQLVANGNTNLHEGFMWGWRTISPVGPFSQGSGYSTLNNRKIMIFMTDGFNNWSSYTNTVGGSSYEALGYYSYNGNKNLRLPDGSNGDKTDHQTVLAAAANKSSSYQPQSRTAQDELTLEACTNAKTQGVEIFTIGFSISTDPIDAQGLAVMKNCATNDDHYFPVENAAQLNAAFASIGVGIGKLRLTQ